MSHAYPEGPDQPDRLQELEPVHLSEFAAFRRPHSESLDGLVARDRGTRRLDPALNPHLARRVYSGPEGTIDLIPGPGLIYGEVTYANGQTLSTLMTAGWISSP